MFFSIDNVKFKYNLSFSVKVSHIGLCMVKHPPTPVNLCSHMSPVIFCYYFTDLKHNFHYFIIIIIVLEPLPQPHPRLFPGLFFKNKNFLNFFSSPLNPTSTPKPQFKNSLKCLCTILQYV